ncbi:MAG: hypothetical protein KatS3mg117_2150 [Geminicoccaceae bacterium]|nr:MAG: hypothetical protein KatS3mg117_2150 [Geminicoccaceae bacterium]
MVEAASLARPVGSGEGLRLSIGALRSGWPVAVGPRARPTSALPKRPRRRVAVGLAQAVSVAPPADARDVEEEAIGPPLPTGTRPDRSGRAPAPSVAGRRRRRGGAARPRLRRTRRVVPPLALSAAKRTRRRPRLRLERRLHGRSAARRSKPRSRRDGAVASSGRCARAGRLRRRRTLAPAPRSKILERVAFGSRAEDSSPSPRRRGRGESGGSGRPRVATIPTSWPRVLHVRRRTHPVSRRGRKAVPRAGRVGDVPGGVSAADGVGAGTPERRVARTFPRR